MLGTTPGLNGHASSSARVLAEDAVTFATQPVAHMGAPPHRCQRRHTAGGAGSTRCCKQFTLLGNGQGKAIFEKLV